MTAKVITIVARNAVEGQATTDIVCDPRALMLLPSMCEGFFMK